VPWPWKRLPAHTKHTLASAPSCGNNSNTLKDARFIFQAALKRSEKFSSLVSDNALSKKLLPENAYCTCSVIKESHKWIVALNNNSLLKRILLPTILNGGCLLLN